MTHCKDITNNIKPLYNISEAFNIPYNGGITLECSLVRASISTPTLVYLTISICYYQLMRNGALWTLQHRSHILMKTPKMATIPLIGTNYTYFQPLFVAVVFVTSQIHHALWIEVALKKTHRFLSVHYRPEILFAPKTNASKIEILHPPLVHPIFSTGVCVLPNPRIREITMTLKLQALAPLPFICPNI
jgi:hypothetical protein